MIFIEEVLLIHDRGIQRYGGSYGLRDESMLKSAIERPYQTFGGIDLYPDAISKAAAIIESILMNHPFVDGNKRTGFALMLLILQNANYSVAVEDDEIYNFVIAIASGEMRYEEILIWLQENTKTI